MRSLKLVTCALTIAWLGLLACGTSTPDDERKDGGPATGGLRTGGALVTGGAPATGGGVATGGVATGGIATGGTPGTGGTAGMDAGPMDTGRMDAPEVDAPRLDANATETAAPDASGAEVTRLDGKNADTGGKLTCPGSSPAKPCRTSASDCVPSTCGCDETLGLWICTADCRTNLPLCPDASAVDAGATRDASPADGSATCANDRECQLFSSYCDGCLCLPQKAGAAAPVCTTTIVYCFADPCMAKVPRCLDGVCVAAAPGH